MPQKSSRARAQYEVPPEKLRWRCDPDSLGFSCTHEIRPPQTFIGQERAVSAIEFGLEVDNPGYNIFVTGLPGTGKSTVVQSHIRQAVKQQMERNGTPEVYDWCYVYNFDRPDSPEAIRLPRGGGPGLVRDLGDLLGQVRRDVPAAYNDEAYKSEVRRLTEQSVATRRDLMIKTERESERRGFAIQAGPMGIAVIPLRDGKPVDQAQFMAMSDQEKERVDERRREVAKMVEEAVRQIQQLEQEHAQAIADLDRRVAELTIDGTFGRLMSRYQGNEDVQKYLTGLRQYTLASVGSLRGGEEDDSHQRQGTPGTGQQRPQDPLLPFRVNLFVDNSKTEGTPIIVEDNPTYPRLFGQIERRAMMGTYVTDHMMLKPGALVQASGGYLVLEAREALSHPAVWPALKRILRGGTVRPEDPADAVFAGVFPQGLRPEAIPIKVKVIMSGEPPLYDLLAAYDLDFWEIFKVHSDLDFQMPRDDASIKEYANFICGTCNARKLRHFSSPGVAAVVEHGARLVNDQRRLSVRFGLLVDLLVEASHWAVKDASAMVERAHVEKALDQKVYRSARVADALQEMMVDGTLMVDLEGSKAGQVNGLAVYTTGDLVFGKPGRITATASLGSGGVVNIEREADLSGQTHNKGVLIMAGYLQSRFAQDSPLAVNIHIAFEQSYGMIDGDSASSTELYAILSTLAELPLRQDIAVTGSVNQKGEIQPIGGVNEKIEGFFDLCKAARKLGSSGVMVPARNLNNLMLRPDIVTAVEQGMFHVYAVNTVDEGISLLTGVRAGERGKGGKYRADSVNGRVERRLGAYAEALRRYIPFQAVH